jgi:tetratricopeptide (TPR) repeat protein
MLREVIRHARETIAVRLRAARLAARLSQRQLAGETYTKSYISALERGKMIPSVQALTFLADRLHRRVAYFLGEGDIKGGELGESDTSPRATLELMRLAQATRLTLLLDEAECLIRQHEPDAALERIGASEPSAELGLFQRLRWYWLVGWAWLLRQAPQQAKGILEQGLHLAERLRWQSLRPQKAQLAEMTARLRCLLSMCFCELGQIGAALEACNRCLTAIREEGIADPELTLRVYLTLGNLYLKRGNFTEAGRCYEEVRSWVECVETLCAEGNLYWRLGLAAQACGDLPRATTNMQKALVAFDLQEYLHLAASLRVLFGQALLHLAEFDAAEVHLRQSEAATIHSGDPATLGVVLWQFSALYSARGAYSRAIALAQAGLELAKAYQDRRLAAHLFLTLASSYAGQHDVSAAERCFSEAVSTLEQVGDADLLGQARERLSQFLAEQGRFQEAYEQLST